MQRTQMTPLTTVYASGRAGTSRLGMVVVLSTEMWIQQASYAADGTGSRIAPKNQIERYRSYSDAKGVLVLAGVSINDDAPTAEELLAFAQEVRLPFSGWSDEEAKNISSINAAREAGRRYTVHVVPAQHIQSTWAEYEAKRDADQARRAAIAQSEREYKAAEAVAQDAVRKLVAERAPLPPAVGFRPFDQMNWQKLETIIRVAIDNDHRATEELEDE